MGEVAAFLFMKNLEKEIYRVLTLAGKKGLKTDRIARHVFNSCNSMFIPLDYKEVHVYVSQFLIRKSKNKESWVEKGNGYGVYRLNARSEEARQFKLRFQDAAQEAGERMVQEDDRSLSLF